MRSVYLYLSVGSEQEAEQVYDLLMKGGEAYMPLQETFFHPASVNCATSSALFGRCSTSAQCPRESRL